MRGTMRGAVHWKGWYTYSTLFTVELYSVSAHVALLGIPDTLKESTKDGDMGIVTAWSAMAIATSDAPAQPLKRWMHCIDEVHSLSDVADMRALQRLSDLKLHLSLGQGPRQTSISTCPSLRHNSCNSSRLGGDITTSFILQHELTGHCLWRVASVRPIIYTAMNDCHSLRCNSC